jgi:hexulose-6-phosphate isomerase
MNDSMSRRDFVHAAAATAGLVVAGESGLIAAEGSGKKWIKKAVKLGMVQGKMPEVEKFKLLKELGFDGVEPSMPVGDSRDTLLKARDESGLPIHGGVYGAGWKDRLSHPDPKIRATGVANFKQAIKDAKYLGASSVLLVAAVVDKDTSYDEAYERSQAGIREAIPVAEDLGIKILIENVWNNFLLSPMEAARYVDELDSPMLGWYFDVGNVVRSGWPEQWIRILGKRIGKLDIKEYSRKKQNDEGLWKGFDVKLMEGDCDWPAVTKALREIGYSGWATAEVPGGDREWLADIARRMDKIFYS